MNIASFSHEVDQKSAEMREWYRKMDATQSGQFQLGRLMTLSWQITTGQPTPGMTQRDMMDIGNLAFRYMEMLMFHAAEVDAMEADGKA